MVSRADAGLPRVAPGPGGNPITDQLRPFQDDPLRFLLEVHRTYGDVVRLHLWPQLFHLISHPAGIRHVLATRSENYHWLPAATQRPRSPAGAGPGAEEAAHARRMAKVAHQASHRDRLTAHAPVMVAAVDEMLTGWQRHAEGGEPLDVAPELVRLALTILGRTLFGVDLRGDLAALVPALAVALEHGAPHRGLSGYQWLQQAATPADPALRDAVGTLNRLVARLIAERRRAGPGDGDVLSALVFGRDEVTGATLGDEQLHEVISVVLIAAHSATVDAIAWTFYLLAEHPWAQRRLQAELDAVLGGRSPTAADAAQLRYTLLVLQEALRLYPPVWLFSPRMARRDDEIAGYRIPAGSVILISPWVTHRHPAFWQRPDIFEPERFAGPAPAAYLPFGSGPWGCLGSQFGLLEARLTLAMVAQRFDWRLLPGHPVVPDPQVSLRPRHGLRMVLRPRGVARTPAP